MTRRGFSLIELVMVMSIMGIAAAIAAPRYANSLARYRADLAARRVVADLALAQSRARVTSASCTAVFTSGKSTYQLPGIADFKDPKVDYTVNLLDPLYGATITKVDLGGDESVMFNGYGTPDSGGAIVITVGTIQKTITVDAATGGATIQ